MEYKIAGYDMFNAMTESIEEDTVRAMYHVRVEEKVEREQVAKVTGTNKDDTAVKEPVRRMEKKPALAGAARSTRTVMAAVLFNCRENIDIRWKYAGTRSDEN